MKKSTLNIVILTLVLINLALNVLMIFSVVPTANKTNQLISKIAGIIDLQLEPEMETESGALSVEQIDTRIVSASDGGTKITISVPSSDGKNHYVVTSIAVSLNKSHADYTKLAESFTNAQSMIISKAEAIIASYSYEDATSSKTEMQNRLLEEVRTLFQSNMIYDVSFQGFIVQ